jgi:hypothetical protein
MNNLIKIKDNASWMMLFILIIAPNMFLVAHDWVYSFIAGLVLVIFYFMDDRFKTLRKIDKKFLFRIVILTFFSLCISVTSYYFPDYMTIFSIIWVAMVIIVLMTINNSINKIK